MFDRILLVSVAAVMPLVASAQPIKGGSGANLSERAQFYAYFSGQPDNAAIELIVILRGQPGWARPGSGTVRESAGPIFIDERVPVQHSLTIGSKHFAYTYQPSDRALQVGETRYPLEGANVVVIDRVDGVGGPPTVVRRLKFEMTGKPNAMALADSLRRMPELQEFLR